MNISVRKLEIFLAVAKYGNVTKAAGALRLTQSAVSMALASLEKDAGSQLFKRVGKKMVPNERGRVLLPQAENTMRCIEAFDLAMSPGSELTGELRIGASTTIGNYLLPALVAEFAKANSGVRVAMRVGNTAQICEALAAGEIDIALVEGPVHLRSLESVRWRGDELVVIAAPKHEWAGKRASVKSLTAARWIVRERGSGTREVFEKAMEDCDCRYRAYLELEHTEAIKKAVEAGLGVGCLSRLAVDRELANVWLVEVRTPLKLRRDLNLVTNVDAGGSRLVETCRAFLLHHAT